MTPDRTTKALLLAIAIGLFPNGATSLAQAPAAAAQYRVKMDFNVRVPMRDGVTLSADIYRPDTAGRFPVIVVRTPYDNGTAANLITGKRWAARGFVYLVQDVRGRGDSDGEFYPLVFEAKDGYDTIEWAAAQPWSNGKVGTTGGSYLGWTQVLAATLKPPALAAMVPIVTPTDPDLNFPMQMGAISPSTVSWLAYVDGKTLQDISQLDLFGAYATLPLRDADRALGRHFKAWRDWLDHPARDAYWEPQRYQRKILDYTVPSLHVSGWYDDVLLGTLQNFTNLTGPDAAPAVRPLQRLIIGPWGHGVNRGTRLGDIDFGPTALIDLEGIQARWFNRWLRGEPNGVEQDPPVRIFVMGENVWRNEREWPLARTRYTKFYLHSGGRANSLYGDGRLDTIPPGPEPSDRFKYDPMNAPPFITEPSFSQMGGPDDYRSVERRDDILVYTTDPFPEPVEVCGPLTVHLVAATSGIDTDWATKILDVRPDGFAQRLNDGLVRARYYQDPTRAQFLTPGKPEAYDIDNWATCQLFGRGHRLRLEVLSSAFPKWDRNLNTGGPLGDETRAIVADQTVHHGRGTESWVTIPVVPRPR